MRSRTVKSAQNRKKNLKRARSVGSTLLECIISLQILGIATLGVANAFVTHMKLNSSTEQKSGAVFAASQIVDDYRAQPISTLPSSGSAAMQLVLVGARNYAVQVTFCQDPSRCTSSMRQLYTTVYLQGTKVYEVETVFAQLQ